MTEPDHIEVTSDEVVEVTSDEELSRQLHKLLVVEGRDEVEVLHPVEGNIIVTKETYLNLIEDLAAQRAMSPAERLQAKKKSERKVRQEFVKALNDAAFSTVDITDMERFGFDTDGNELDIDGCSFITVAFYPKGVEYGPDEVGAFVNGVSVLRILHHSSVGLSEAMQLLADDCPPEEAKALLANLEKPERLN